MHPLWYPSKSIRNACLSRGLFHSRKKHRAMFHFVENGIGETAKNFRCVFLKAISPDSAELTLCCFSSTDLSAYIKRDDIVHEARDALKWIFSLSLCVYGAKVVKHCPDLGTVFLSAYAFRYGSIQAKTPTELSLLSSARLLLEEFDEISRIMKDTKYFLNVPSLLSRNFCSHMIEYIKEYRCWEKIMVSA